MRAFVITTFALAVALVPAAALAQATTPTAAAASRPAAPPAEPAQAEPKIPFTTPAGMLLVQIKPDKTAVFEEMVGKLKAGIRQDAGRRRSRSRPPASRSTRRPSRSVPNTLYVVLVEPTVAAVRVRPVPDAARRR